MTAQLKQELQAMRHAQEVECEHLWKEHEAAEKELQASPLQAKFDATLQRWFDANRQLEGLTNLLKNQP